MTDLLAPVTDPAAATIEKIGTLTAPVLPPDSVGGIEFGEGSDALRVLLPPQASGPARSSGPGHAVYDGPTADSVVQADLTGLRIATVSPAAGAAQQRFQYRFELSAGSVLLPRSDGSVAIVDDDGGTLALIGAPWAKDGSGRSLPTSYAVYGDTLTQTVNTTNAVGDVTADPHVQFIGPSLNPLNPRLPVLRTWFTRRETELFYRNIVFTGQAQGALTLACGLIPNTVVRTACAAVVQLVIGDFNTNVVQAHNRGRCLTADFKVGGAPVLDWQDRSGSHCRP